MRMPSDELCRDRLDDGSEIEGSLLLGHAGMEDDLKEEVSQFISQIEEISPLDRVGHFVGLFDREGHDSLEGLLQIPVTTGPRSPESSHDLDQTVDVSGRFHAASRFTSTVTCDTPGRSVKSRRYSSGVRGSEDATLAVTPTWPGPSRQR
jgi:hypothetical protein